MRWMGVALGAGLVALLQAAWAQGGIFTCVDASGRRMTSDRPIPECADRAQRELNPSGSLKRDIAAPMTPSQAAAQAERERQADADRQRLQEQRRKERALISRYPNREAHDRERAAVLSQLADRVRVVEARRRELGVQRAALDTEMEFYAKDPAKAPSLLRRKLDENAAEQADEQRSLADLAAEQRRVNQRFDEDLDRLQLLWAPPAGAAGTAGR